MPPPAVTETPGVPANPQAESRALAASVRISVPGGAGSGTLIDVEKGNGLILTCAHLWGENGRFSGSNVSPQGCVVYFQNGQAAPATAIWRAQGYDVAAIAIRMPAAIEPVPVTEPPVQPNTPVFAIGFGPWYASSGPRASNAPSRPTVKRGVCNGRNFGTGEYGFTFRPQSGDSGGGVFRSDDGALMSVVTISTTDPGSPGGATGRPIIREFLAKHVTQLFPNWDKRRPQPPGQQPQQPYQQPAPAIPADLIAKLEDGRRRLEALEKQLIEQGKINIDFSRVREEFDSLRREIRDQRDGDANRKQGQALQLADLTNRLELLSSGFSKLRDSVKDLDGVAEKVRPLIPIVVERSHQVERIISHVATLEKLSGRADVALGLVERLSPYASWLPLIAGGAATGGSVPLVMLWLAGYRLFRRRLGTVPDGKAIPVTPGVANQPPFLDLHAVLLQLLAAQQAKASGDVPPESKGHVCPETLIVKEGKPMPGERRIDQKYVIAEKDNGQLEATYWAMQEMVKDAPALKATFDYLKALAAQYESGQKKGQS